MDLVELGNHCDKGDSFSLILFRIFPFNCLVLFVSFFFLPSKIQFYTFSLFLPYLPCSYTFHHLIFELCFTQTEKDYFFLIFLYVKDYLFLSYLTDYLDRGLSILCKERNTASANKFITSLKNPSVAMLDSLYDALELHNMVFIYVYMSIVKYITVISDIRGRRKRKYNWKDCFGVTYVT